MSLVAKGAVAAVDSGNGSAAPTYGAATKAGDYAVCLLFSNSSATTDPYTCSDSTWKKLLTAGGPYGWLSLWYTLNLAAGETAPTWDIAGGASVGWAQLREYVGTSNTAPDQSGSAAGSASPTAIAAASDTGSTDDIIVAAGFGGSNNITYTSALTDSSGASVTVSDLDTNADGTRSQGYWFADGVAHATGADKDTVALTASAYTGSTAIIASFNTPSGGGSVTVVGVTATATGAAPVGNAGIGAGSPVAQATASAPAGVVDIIGGSPLAQATAAAPAGSVLTGMVVAGSIATAAAAAPAGGVSSSAGGITAQAAAAAPAGGVSSANPGPAATAAAAAAGGTVTIAAGQTTATGSAAAPTGVATGSATVAGLTALANAEALAGLVVILGAVTLGQVTLADAARWQVTLADSI